MTRIFMVPALACALAACNGDPSQDKPATPAPAATAPGAGDDAQDAPGSTRVTIYSGDYQALSQGYGGSETGYALVSRDLRFELQAGANNVAVDELPQGIDVAATSLRATTPGVTVGAQRYLAPLAGADQVFARAIGRRVAVDHTSGGARQTDNGILVAAGDGLTLALSDGRYKVIREFDSLSVLDTTNLPGAEPQLRWQVQAQQAGPAGFHFEYPTGGLAWRAEYVGRLADGAGSEGDACSLALTGSAMVANRSGADFAGVNLTLVAGEPRRAPATPTPVLRMQKAEMASFAAADASAPQAQASGEYQSYRLPNPGDLPQGSVQRLPLVDAVSGIACERRYETRHEMGDWRPPYPLLDENFGAGDGQPQPVVASLRFTNAKSVGLGMPLPAGRVRMFDGADFLGEASLPHTPAGKDVALEIGNVFDLAAERTRESFQVDRTGRTMTETVSLRITNGRASAVTVRVHERLGRWTDWEIVDSSARFEKRNAQSASFDVAVPANGATTLRYTVRYRWAADVRIP